MLYESISPTYGEDQIRAINLFAFRRTAKLVDHSDEKGGGTGVLLAVGDRCFVITAAHVIRNDHDISILGRDGFNSHHRGFVAKYCDKNNDIGILEVPANVASSLGEGHAFLSPIELYRARYPSQKTTICVLGYPTISQEVSRLPINDANTIVSIECGTLYYETSTLRQGEFPELSVDSRQTSQTNDIFCNYDMKPDELVRKNLKDHNDKGQMLEMESIPLKGMSGCGMWIPVSKTNKSGIWEPSAWLVGIQTSYPRNGRGTWLRGTRTKAVVALLKSRYPDLREELG